MRHVTQPGDQLVRDDLKRYLISVSGRLSNTGDDQAQSLLQRFLVIDPFNPKVWSRLGNAVGSATSPATGAAYQLRSLVCAPDARKPRRRLDHLLRTAPFATAGLSPTLLAELLGPDDGIATMAVASARLARGEVDAACTLLRRVTVVDPSIRPAWTMLALAASLAGDAVAAKRLWWAAWLANPDGFTERYDWVDRISARAGVDIAVLPLLARLAGSKGRDVDDRRALIASVAERSEPAAPAGRRTRLVEQPLILISQIQRSGGSMILQLLDNHPEVFAYPYELILGRRLKSDWPDLDLSAGAEQWMRQLLEPWFPLMAMRGFAKPGHNRLAMARLPFSIDVPGLIREFLTLARRSPRDQRALLDRYFSAFMRSWKDFEPSGRERWVAAFAPRLVMHPLGMRRYWRDYPDGHLVCCVRHPRSWLISARRHNNSYANHETALALWQMSVEAILDQHARNPRATSVVLYEELVSEPEAEMRRLAADLGIVFRRSLLVPTFNGRPLPANSSFDVSGTGIHRESLSRSDTFPEPVETYLEEQALPVYREASRVVDQSRRPAASTSATGDRRG